MVVIEIPSPPRCRPRICFLAPFVLRVIVVFAAGRAPSYPCSLLPSFSSCPPRPVPVQLLCPVRQVLSEARAGRTKEKRKASSFKTSLLSSRSQTTPSELPLFYLYVFEVSQPTSPLSPPDTAPWPLLSPLPTNERANVNPALLVLACWSLLCPFKASLFALCASCSRSHRTRNFDGRGPTRLATPVSVANSHFCLGSADNGGSVPLPDLAATKPEPTSHV